MTTAPNHAAFRTGRRGLLLGLAATMASGGARAAFARAAGESRLVVVILRGAMDGLHVVQPYGDGAALQALRAPLLLPEPGRDGGLLDLGGFFGLHPAMPALHGMFAANEALVLHAAAGPWRTRSHFEAQDLLEGGGEQRLTSGWLNRALSAVPAAGTARAGLAVGGGVPLLLRGPTPVGAYAPPGLDRPSPDLFHRAADLNGADPVLGPAFAEGMRARGFARTALGEPSGEERDRNAFPLLAAAAARLLATPDGPRVAALEIGGWDTHAGQANRILGPLRALDDGLAALRAGLGAHWARTAVLVMTEFGRTARVNGNLGTDHGTAGVAFLAGGAVRGGRVLADWPGLDRASLLDGRDLAPTLDLRRAAKALLADHLGLPGAAVAGAFPGSAEAPALRGVLRA